MTCISKYIYNKYAFLNLYSLTKGETSWKNLHVDRGEKKHLKTFEVTNPR